MEFPTDSEMGASVVSEIANIVSGAFLNALNGMTGLSSQVTPPKFYSGPFRGAFHAVLDLLSRWGDQTFVCETAFVSETETVQSHLIFMPGNPEQLELILHRMGLPEVFEIDAAS
jgi:chemotaxis protein CheY-P-specific phosphatase CheC